MTLSAGTASAIITPPVGTWLEGYGGKDHGSTGVHDDLYAHALGVDDGDTTAGFVSCDLLGVDRKLVEQARRIAADATGMAPEHIMVAATHTHQGPAGLRFDADDELMDVTARAIAGAIAQAHAAKRPAVLKLGSTTVESIMQNRRHPEWPVDADLYVLLFDDVDPLQPPIAALVNGACHPTVLYSDNYLISADYPGHAVRVVEQTFPGIGMQFFNGACGNVNPNWIKQTHEEAERVGTVVGSAAARLIAELRPLGNTHHADNIRWSEHIEKPVTAGELAGDVRLRVASRNVDLPIKTYLSDEEYDAKLTEHQEQLDALGDAPDPERRRPIMAQLNRYRTERMAAKRMRSREGDALHPELMAISFAPGLALLGLPGEWFVESVADIRTATGIERLLVACYANHYMGYVVPEAAYEEGGYEPGVSLLAPEAEGIAKAAAIDLMKEVLQ